MLLPDLPTRLSADTDQFTTQSWRHATPERHSRNRATMHI